MDDSIQAPFTEDRPLRLSAEEAAKLSPVLKKLREGMEQVVTQANQDPFEKAMESDVFKRYR